MTDDHTSNQNKASVAGFEEYDPFAAQGLSGRGGRWRYVAGAVAILVIWQISVVPLVLIVGFVGSPEALNMLLNQINWVDISPEQDPAALASGFILLMSLVLLLVATWLVLRLLHGRTLLSAMTSHSKFRFRTLLVSLAAFVAVMVPVSLISMVVLPASEVEVVFDPSRYFPFLMLVLTLTPFQCLAEEVFVRGYLFQGVSRFTRAIWLRIALPAFLFMLLHATNSDFAEGGVWAILIFFTIGAYLGILTIRTGGVEAATGVHMANNILAFSVSTSGGAGMPFATIFYEPEPNYMLGYFTLIAMCALHYWVFDRLCRSGRAGPTAPVQAPGE